MQKKLFVTVPRKKNDIRHNDNMYNTFYSVAEHIFCIKHDIEQLDRLLPSYIPFKTEDAACEPLFTITIDNDMQRKWQGERLGYFPSNTANFTVYRQEPADYQILIQDYNDEPCAFMQTERSKNNITMAFRGNDLLSAYGLNNAIMVAYAFCTAPHRTLLMHSSVVENNGRGYCFLGESGRGKSTHSDLWVRHIKGSTLVNDDNPVLRIDDDGTPIIHGSPWSGKRPIYKKVHYPIAGLTEIEQHGENIMTRRNIATSFAILLSSCSTLKFDRQSQLDICKTIGMVLKNQAVYTLQCRPDEEAAILSSSILGV